ncbi:hypothetical protein RRG08_017405 [Elysia crispata]|uniref:Uncharacterized protein n=1 Tax=Elysia crispata TaxID=231223 RepID=A0AAE0ZPY0_9GAST|nr:hypothetical protein RRG08_017405 [Elysia crispata]
MPRTFHRSVFATQISYPSARHLELELNRRGEVAESSQRVFPEWDPQNNVSIDEISTARAFTSPVAS